MPTRNLTGETFGRLTVVGRSVHRQAATGRMARKRNWTLPLWECRCACGEIIQVPTSKLTTGNTQSCGCLQRDWAKHAGRQVSSHTIPKFCVGCGIGFRGTNKQKYHDRACKEKADLSQWDDRYCAQCGKALPAKVRTGRREDYCDQRCKRHAQAARQAGTEAATVAAELQRRLTNE